MRSAGICGRWSQIQHNLNFINFLMSHGKIHQNSARKIIKYKNTTSNPIYLPPSLTEKFLINVQYSQKIRQSSALKHHQLPRICNFYKPPNFYSCHCLDLTPLLPYLENRRYSLIYLTNDTLPSRKQRQSLVKFLPLISLKCSTYQHYSKY